MTNNNSFLLSDVDFNEVRFEETVDNVSYFIAPREFYIDYAFSDVFATISLEGDKIYISPTKEIDGEYVDYDWHEIYPSYLEINILKDKANIPYEPIKIPEVLESTQNCKTVAATQTSNEKKASSEPTTTKKIRHRFIGKVAERSDISEEIIQKIKEYNKLNTDVLVIDAMGHTETRAEYLIRALTPFVHWYLNNYYTVTDGLMREEMCQHAFKAISEHAKEFDPEAGYTPSTFFAPHIKGELSSYFKNTTGISSYKSKVITQVKDAIENSEHSLSVKEIAERTSLTEGQVKEALTVIDLKEQNIFPEWSDPNKTDAAPTTKAEESEFAKEIRNALNILDEKELFIVKAKFGLDENPLSTNKISQELNISESEVSNILKRALGKLQKSKEMQSLHGNI
jgi:RNA polymerase sigma factor (sigma-70 family)